MRTVVVEVWHRVLGIEGVSAGDDFFDLGGDSLAATRIAELLSAELGAEVDSVAVFEHSTVETLARFLTSRATTADAGHASA